MFRTQIDTRQYPSVAFSSLPTRRLDAETFSHLYISNVHKVYKYIYSKVGSPPLAEDLTAQVFLKAWQARRHFHWTQYPFSAWLFRIAHNLVVDHYRVRHETVMLDDLTPYESTDNVEELAEQQLNSESLRQALKQLTNDQHQVIHLKFLEGYGTAEVATMMSRDPTAIRALQHRALMALHRILQSDIATQAWCEMPQKHPKNSTRDVRPRA